MALGLTDDVLAARTPSHSYLWDVGKAARVAGGAFPSTLLAVEPRGFGLLGKDGTAAAAQADRLPPVGECSRGTIIQHPDGRCLPVRLAPLGACCTGCNSRHPSQST
jgi:hypothetical protein